MTIKNLRPLDSAGFRSGRISRFLLFTFHQHFPSRSLFWSQFYRDATPIQNSKSPWQRIWPASTTTGHRKGRRNGVEVAKSLIINTW